MIQTRTNSLFRRFILFLIAVFFIFTPISTAFAQSSQSATPVDNTAKLKSSFRNANDVLYSDDSCASGSSSDSSSDSGSGDGGPCGIDTDKDKSGIETNKKQIWNFFVNKFKGSGFTQDEAEKAAAGVLGNSTVETGGTYNSYINRGSGCPPDNKPAAGIFQWCFGRKGALQSFAKERGKDQTCLGVQLEFAWMEWTTNFKEAAKAIKGKSPGEAANVWDDGGDGASTGIPGFEESWDQDNAQRNAAGEAAYKEMTGKGGGASTVSNTGSGSSSSDTSSTSSSESCSSGEEKTADLPADCGGLGEEFKKLRAAGKIKSINGNANADADLAACGKVDNGSNCVGVTPELLKAVVALTKYIDSKGLGPVVFANMNKGHPCDGLKHPNGKAIDLWYGSCDGSAVYTHPGCKETVNWIVQNAGQFGITQGLHNPCAITGLGNDYGSCSKGGVLFYEPTETEMIHMGVK